MSLFIDNSNSERFEILSRHKNLFECMFFKGKNCTGVRCPLIPDCPPDSYQLPSRTSSDECCSTPMGCQCLPNINCEIPTCASDLTPILMEKFIAEPGKCCPLYRCGKPGTHFSVF